MGGLTYLAVRSGFLECSQNITKLTLSYTWPPGAGARRAKGMMELKPPTLYLTETP